MIHTTRLAATHMECRNLQDSVRVLTELLAFDKLSEKPAEATLKHPNTHWLLVVHEAGPEAPAKPMHNHWGVRVVSPEEVDRAYDYLVAHKADYKLGAIGKPTWSHGSYSCYFVEPGTNGWEIECYEAFNRKQTTAERFGAVKTAHWDQLLPQERFPGRGYVPQGFTHGTLVATDLEASRKFYVNTLNLDVHRFSDHVIYIKHPRSKTFVVCAVRQNAPVFSPNFRNTLTVATAVEVKAAYRALSERGDALGVRELLPLHDSNGSASFCFRDPGTNCWEIVAEH